MKDQQLEKNLLRFSRAAMLRFPGQQGDKNRQGRLCTESVRGFWQKVCFLLQLENARRMASAGHANSLAAEAYM